MFYYVKGTVVHTEPNLAVIDCGGVGYACRTSQYTLASLKTGEVAKLYTYLHVREELFELYGFHDQEELDCFKLLIGISGVGPKAALAILSVVSPSKLALSVIAGDEKAFTQAPGVGKKLAQRIVLELKDKMTKEQLAGAQANPDLGFVQQAEGGAQAEAFAALAVLGYSRAEAAAAMNGIDTANLAVEDIIKLSLKWLVR